MNFQREFDEEVVWKNIEHFIRQIRLHALLHGQIQLYIFDGKSLLGAFRDKTADAVQNKLTDLELYSQFCQSRFLDEN